VAEAGLPRSADSRVCAEARPSVARMWKRLPSRVARATTLQHPARAASRLTNLTSTRRAAGETLASPGEQVAQLVLLVIELDFCVPERAGTTAAVNDTDEMDDLEQPVGRQR
jgi:hypothetical protein